MTTKKEAAVEKYNTEIDGIRYQIIQRAEEYEVWIKQGNKRPKPLTNPATDRPEFHDFGSACYELFRYAWVLKPEMRQQKLSTNSPFT